MFKFFRSVKKDALTLLNIIIPAYQKGQCIIQKEEELKPLKLRFIVSLSELVLYSFVFKVLLPRHCIKVSESVIDSLVIFLCAHDSDYSENNDDQDILLLQANWEFCGTTVKAVGDVLLKERDKNLILFREKVAKLISSAEITEKYPEEIKELALIIDEAIAVTENNVC